MTADSQRHSTLSAHGVAHSPNLVVTVADGGEALGVNGNLNFLFALIGEAVTVAVFQCLRSNLAGVVNPIYVAVVPGEFGGVIDPVVVAVGVCDGNGVEGPRRDA